MDGKTDRELLEEIHKMLEESNRTVQKIHARGRWSMIFGVLKWAFYFVILIGSYYFIQNNLGSVIKLYTGVQENSDTLNEIKAKTSSLDMQSMLDLLGR